jgi:hypothetical protein
MNMSIDHAILINQMAQGIVAIGDGERWFSAFNLEFKRSMLREINAMILQAHPALEDPVSAIAASGLKETLTPCVLLAKPGIKVQLAKLANLPESELTNVLKLLVRLLGIADMRRLEMRQIDTVNHWWHRDLRNPQVVAEIREHYRKS